MTPTPTHGVTPTPTPVAAPVITSAASAGVQAGVAFSFHLTTTNAPTTFAASGLPAGLNVDPATGLITGAPALPAGTFTVTLSVTNAGGTGTASFTLTVTVPEVTVVALGDKTLNEATVEKGKIAVRRTGDTSVPLTVHYKVRGTALCGVDYKMASGTVTIPVGATQAKVSAGCVWLAEVSGGEFAHDAANRFLNREQFSPKDLFEQARPLMEAQGGTLSVDDSVLEKPYSQESKADLVGCFWSRKAGGAVQRPVPGHALAHGHPRLLLPGQLPLGGQGRGQDQERALPRHGGRSFKLGPAPGGGDGG